MPPSAIFEDLGLFRFQMYGSGNAISATSVKMLGIAFPRKKSQTSTLHFADKLLFQNPATGMHWKIVTNI